MGPPGFEPGIASVLAFLGSPGWHPSQARRRALVSVLYIFLVFVFKFLFFVWGCFGLFQVFLSIVSVYDVVGDCYEGWFIGCFGWFIVCVGGGALGLGICI